ncbi:MAG: cupin domain-containing protein [Nitrospirae bacterium]|nr:cupin domain-containing protein [Nitrospirota bacterium]MCZ6780983.1 cupin domain-containing protein [Nitrospirota bacterium]MEC4668587.1 cupin domain-containing protein [Nitrospirota bacterium]MEC4688523.1 cupin domain-containing protein [Nitrospirota bacterium]
MLLDRTLIERDWRARGFSCELWTDGPGQEWNDFVHGTDELLLVVEGELELEMQGRIFRPKPGEEILTGGQGCTLGVWV